MITAPDQILPQLATNMEVAKQNLHEFGYCLHNGYTIN